MASKYLLLGAYALLAIGQLSASAIPPSRLSPPIIRVDADDQEDEPEDDEVENEELLA